MPPLSTFVRIAALAGVMACSWGSASYAVTRCETTACLKSILDQVLFAEEWRTPDRTTWVARRDKEYKFVTVPTGAWAPDGFQLTDPNLQFIAVNAITRITARRKFPMFANVGVKVAKRRKQERIIDLDTFEITVLKPGMFEASFSWDWQNEMDGPIKHYISRGCFYSINIWLDFTLTGANVVIKSTLSEAEVENCIEEAMFYALGLVDVRHPHRDLALKVLYHPMVQSGMTRDELFKLIDNGSIPVPR